MRVQDNRRVTVLGTDAVTISASPVPDPGHGEVRVRSTMLGICGSYLHAAHSRHPSMPMPYQPGHEVVAVVDELGDGTSGLALGDRVFLERNLVCRQCRNYHAGRYNICQHLAVFGCQTPGAVADYFSVAADRLQRVPDDIPDEAAVLVEPLATPVHAVRLAAGVDPVTGGKGLTGKDVAVLGAGPVGLFTLIAARGAEARRVVVTDLSDHKRVRAVRLGADAVVTATAPDLVSELRAEPGNSPDVVLDCVAVPATVAPSISLLEKGGTEVVVDVPSGSVPLRLDLVQDWEITVRDTFMYTTEDVVAATQILRSGRVPLKELVSDVLPLDRAQETFARGDSGAGVKVLVRVAE
jgi:L-iditol 2-dehydrogenase